MDGFQWLALVSPNSQIWHARRSLAVSCFEEFCSALGFLQVPDGLVLRSDEHGRGKART